MANDILHQLSTRSAAPAPETSATVVELESAACADGHAAQRPSRAGHAIIAALVLGLLGFAWMRGSQHPQPAAHAGSAESTELAARCEQSDAVACNDFGVGLWRGESGTPDARAAFRVFVRACDGGSADGCSNLGALYERGIGGAADLDAALALYERACIDGNALGCSNLGALYATGRGTERDREAAQHLFELACETGSATGCENLEALTRTR
jgi:TPR repeat protein